MTGKIFVYGSLMTDFFNYNKILIDQVIKKEKGYILGTLYHLDNKGYPAFIKEGNTRVYGEILTIKDFDRVLIQMDGLENYTGIYNENNEYNRITIEVHHNLSDEKENLGVYVYNPMAPKNKEDRALLISHGNWRAYMEQEHKEAI